MSGDTEKKMTT
jgi:WD40 repeat protein